MNLRTLSHHPQNFWFIEKVSMIDFEIMKERRSFRQKLKLRESGRSGNRLKSGRARRSVELILLDCIMY
jgi:hypothetical protein